MENSQARLRILFPPGVDRTVPIDRDPFLIGHGSGADLILESDDRSPISASICREGLSYVLEDRGTAFGISVNGIPSVSRVLSNRDTITLGRDRRLEVVFLKDDPMSRILRRVDSCSRVGVSPAHYRNLALLLEICNGLNSMTSLQDILELALDAVIDVTCADRGFLMLKDESGALRVRVARKIDITALDRGDPDSVARIAEEVGRRGDSRLVLDTGNHDDRRSPGRSAGCSPGTVICVPIRALPSTAVTRPERRGDGNSVLGVIYVDSSRAHGPMSDVDKDLINSIAVQAALALDNFFLRQEELERRLGELETEREMDRLREVDRIKTEFLSNVSHELRTPLTALKGSIENMIDGFTGGLTDQQRHYLFRMNDNAEQLHRLINDLLDLARIEAGTIALRPRSTSVTRLMDDAAEGMRSLAERRGIVLQSDPPPQDLVIVADRDRLIQVLFNLISNSLKFTPPGGAVTLSAVRREASVAFSVTDTGAGIPEPDLERVFHRFYQAPASGAAKTVGTGLGLPISRSLVEVQGGRLWAERVASGSRLTFTLPIRSDSRSEPGTGQP